MTPQGEKIADGQRVVQGERLARVEEQVLELKDKVNEMDKKLDALLDLRSKGMGILWVLAGLLAVALEFFRYFFSFRHG